MEHQDLLRELTSRLPELEWNMRQVSSAIPMENIPKGLFRCQGKSMTAASCIAEIKEDIRFLHLQTNNQSAHYVASRMRQKVNVIVFLCQKRPKTEDKIKDRIKINSLSTRRQWVQVLEEEILALEQQKEALLIVLVQMESKNNASGLLSVQGELGKLEARLTLAKEKLDQIVF